MQKLKNINLLKGLYERGLTKVGYMALVKNTADADIDADLELLMRYKDELHFPFEKECTKFMTRLWMLAGEIMIPNNLGWQPRKWPVLVYPMGMPYLNEIKDFAEGMGLIVSQTKDIIVSLDLFLCIYAGKPWLPALKRIYLEHFKDKKKGQLLYFEKSPNSGTGVRLCAAIRKMQTILRPTLPSLKKAYPDLHYPGLITAFHSPALNDIGVQRIILDKHLNGEM